MNSLEDAYVNIAKAEEKLHEGERQIPEFLRDDDLENNPMFIRYLQGKTHSGFFIQVWAVITRRFYEFMRDSKMQVLLVSPFVTSIFTLIIIKGIIGGSFG